MKKKIIKCQSNWNQHQIIIKSATNQCCTSTENIRFLYKTLTYQKKKNTAVEIHCLMKLENWWHETSKVRWCVHGTRGVHKGVLFKLLCNAQFSVLCIHCCIIVFVSFMRLAFLSFVISVQFLSKEIIDKLE